jgi:hypothetical protein
MKIKNEKQIEKIFLFASKTVKVIGDVLKFFKKR